MATFRTVLTLLIVPLGWTSSAAGQERTGQLDSMRAQIQTTLRRFYFNLAHQDWEALTADILAAKVVAHRPAPEAMVVAGNQPRGHSPGNVGRRALAASPACPSGAVALVDRAVITLEEDWAEVSLPNCSAVPSGVDQFRLIKFEERWRIVYIDLFEEPVNLSNGR